MKISEHAAELIISLYRQISHAEDFGQNDELGRLNLLLKLPGKLKENLNEALNQEQNKLFEHRLDAMITQSEQLIKSKITADAMAIEQLINRISLINNDLTELKNEINKGI